MARKEINVGTSPNKGDGDPLRTAFRKINENFAELYTGNFAEPDAITSNLAPDTDGTYDLGESDKRWADLYVKDFIYLNGSRIELTPNGTLLINGGPPAERQDTLGSVFADDSTVMVDGIAGKVVGPVETTTVDATAITSDTVAAKAFTGDLTGSVFADDSTLMVDGVTHTINLNGTVRGHIIPSEDEQFDIGSATNRFKDIYLKGTTIDLGGMKISNTGNGLQIATELEGGEAFATGWWDTQWFKVGPNTDGPEIKVRIDDVPADPTNQAWIDFLRNIEPGDTFTIKTPVEETLTVTTTVVEDHFSDTQFRFYFGVDIAPDIVGDDTYVYLVTADSVPANNLRIKYSPSTTDDWGFGSTPSNVAGALDLLAEWITNRDITNITGSVFADDSTLLVDGVNGKIVGPVEADVTGNVTGNVIGNLTGNTQGSVFGEDSTLLVDGINSVVPKAVVEDSANWDTAFAWGNHAMAGYQSATAPFTGDVKGSVFADDSTVLVDSVNGKITGDVETTSVTAIGIKTSIVDNNGGPLQIKAGLTTDSGNTIFINPYGSNTFIQSQAETHTWITGPYLDAGPNPSLEFKTAGAFKALDGAFFEGNLTGNVTGNLTGNVTGDVNGSIFADDSTLLVDGANGTVPASVISGTITNTIDTNTIATSSGNLSMTADNYVIIDSANNGQIEIGRASGVGNVIIGNADNGTDVNFEGNVTMEGTFMPPMLTQAEVDALTPALGMMIYNTTTGKFQGYAADANNDSTTGWADLH